MKLRLALFIMFVFILTNQAIAEVFYVQGFEPEVSEIDKNQKVVEKLIEHINAKKIDECRLVILMTGSGDKGDNDKDYRRKSENRMYAISTFIMRHYPKAEIYSKTFSKNDEYGYVKVEFNFIDKVEKEKFCVGVDTYSGKILVVLTIITLISLIAIFAIISYVLIKKIIG
jgi:hypothetical protein